MSVWTKKKPGLLAGLEFFVGVVESIRRSPTVTIEFGPSPDDVCRITKNSASRADANAGPMRKSLSAVIFRTYEERNSSTSSATAAGFSAITE
jgi:hypothetical protein